MAAASIFRLRRAHLPSLTAFSRSVSSSAAQPGRTSLQARSLLSPASGIIPCLPSQPHPLSYFLGVSWSRNLSTSHTRITDLKDGDEIDENTILFEGCDFNHWLITMDFPKDHPPTPEEMVRTYEETCAKGLNISIEEAKLRMYACSTTTYQGFQAVMTEEESEQFRGLPGVVFILPDSYIDPQNKQYGGDKYENGVITPRPPPVQYRPRRRETSRYDRRGNPQYDYQAQRPPQQNYPPQQNFSPPGQFDQRPQQNYPPQQNFSPPGQFDQRPQQNFGPPGQFDQRPQQNFGPPGQFDQRPQQNFGPPGQFDQGPQQNFGPPGQFDQRPQQNYPPQQNYMPPPQNYPQQNYGPHGPGNHTDSMPTDNLNYNSSGTNPRQTQRSDQMPPNYGQGDRWNQGPPMQNNFGRDNRNYVPPSPGGPYGPGTDGSQGQVPTGPYGPGPNSGYGQGDHRNYGPGGQGGRDQGRF
ncbi:hypothetical protein MLD38_032466 [Melastoma candidum]|uniref:Uncharacterized protein n=1 Tax=Melastoma candidum TaxID=119954 RepID=A0ACB9M5Y6_9MYRT|nr:hypothetical protein MLD38_032466 [Melastoma candidum]